MWRRLLAFLGRRGGSATARGARLLKDNLSATQLAAYRLSGSFEVVGCDTGRRYRIHGASLLNVAELDQMLAQKLALELFETEALAKANKYPPSKLSLF